MKRINQDFTKGVALLVILFLISVTPLFTENRKTDTYAINFESNGETIFGWFYKALGTGPFPTIILLHGYPGSDGDLFNLGQKLAEEGYNALTFNYPGTWRSEGLYTPETSLKSVESAIDFVKSEKCQKIFDIDTSNISLIGYCYGGGLALLGSLYDNNVKKVITIAGGDLSVVANKIEKSPEYRKFHQQFLENCMSDSAVSRGLGGKASHEWLLRNRDDYDLKRFSGELAAKDILLIGGWLDNTIMIEDHILPLYRSLQKHSAANLEIHIFKTDHSFENVRTDLFLEIKTWLKK